MNSSLRVTIQSILLFAATVLFCITAALSLSPLFYIAAAAVFLIINIIPCLSRTLSGKLLAEQGGADLLCSFLVLLPCYTVFAPAAAAVMPEMSGVGFWINVLIIYVSELIVFWNGIIRVYVTSSMLGTRWRIIGILCGMIPVANIIVLLHILRIARSELSMERRRIINNKEREKQNVCRTKYPIVLVHGVFFRDLEKFNYWGRIPAELEKNGAQLFYGNQQSSLDVKSSAEEIAEKIRKIIEKTGCEKVNIIAHSKGGLDSRYAVSCLGMDKYVASLTTINTPHRGCEFADWLFEKAPEALKNGIADKYNTAFRLLGDTSPDFLGAVSDLTASSCRKLNEIMPDSSNVYYQSVGSKINKAAASIFPLNFSHMIASYFDGPNDGLVSVSSAKWGSNFTYLESKSPDGVSHADVIDLMRHDKPDLDIREFYVQLVSGLRERGF